MKQNWATEIWDGIIWLHTSTEYKYEAKFSFIKHTQIINQRTAAPHRKNIVEPIFVFLN